MPDSPDGDLDVGVGVGNLQSRNSGIQINKLDDCLARDQVGADGGNSCRYL